MSPFYMYEMYHISRVMMKMTTLMKERKKITAMALVVMPTLLTLSTSIELKDVATAVAALAVVAAAVASPVVALAVVVGGNVVDDDDVGL